ncbi:glycosyltransferase [Leptolyngbya sp. CCNP1308]|uniref:glycosyltransferase n=1 Tax=Leptolyngbya sp. CCNP1308 TaxID=3110255 RepID=UPI002B208633|nr:glycosyltransferase [Leptolyngbya sp. CCNP1308]MEA5450987.1 glycosyltransferase [Leptolyngbya sp. CCNP1308]
MRIAFLVADFPCLSETFVLNQVTGLIDRGHQVDIYTNRVGDWAVSHPDVGRYRLWERTYPMPEVPQNYIWRALKGFWLALIHIHRAPLLILRSLNLVAYGEQALNLWLLYTAVALVGRPQAYDIIHCQFGTQGYRGLAFKRLLRSTPRLLLMFRGFDISRYVQEGGDRVYRQLFPDVDYCLANCDFFRHRVLALGWSSDRIAVHFSGLDTNKFTFRPRQLEPDQPVRLATTGRLVEKKGLEFAIRAVAQQAQRYPNLTYTIIGDGPLHPALQQLIIELQAESYIHLVGWKNEAEIVEILDRCHLFVAPSVTAADGNQDAPVNVLKEAMAMGLPVLSTYHGGIPELVEDGVSGFLVPERDADALAERLGYLLDHPERWPELGIAGRRFVERHFDIQMLNDRLVQVYDRLLSPVNQSGPRSSDRTPLSPPLPSSSMRPASVEK